jgi:hypothetical protein
VQYVGIDSAYRRAAWCARGEGGAIVDKGVVAAHEDGLARWCSRWARPRVRGDDERRRVGARSARGRELAGRGGRRAHGLGAGAVGVQDREGRRARAPELCRGDRVPAVWLPSLADRELRERLKRRMQLLHMRTMARNRIQGVLTQWGLKLPVGRLRAPDRLRLLEARGVPQVWQRSVSEALAVIDWLDGRLAALERELGPLAPRRRARCAARHHPERRAAARLSDLLCVRSGDVVVVVGRGVGFRSGFEGSQGVGPAV